MLRLHHVPDIKLQIPTSKTPETHTAVWCLALLWSLELGMWMLLPSHRRILRVLYVSNGRSVAMTDTNPAATRS